MKGQRAFGRLGAAGVSQAVASAGSLATTLVLARRLGLADFGLVALVLLVAGFGAGLVQALAAQPFLSLGDRARAPERAASLVAVAGLLALLSGLVAAFLGPLWIGVAAGPALCAALARTALPAARALTFARGHSGLVLAVDALGGFGGLGCAWLLAELEGWTPENVLLGLAVGAGLGGLVASFALNAEDLSPRPRRLLASLRRSWRSGRWLAATQAFSWLGTGSVHVAAVSSLGAAAVGALRAAQAIVGVAGVALQALELALPGSAAEARREGTLAPWTTRTAACAAGVMAAGAVLLLVCAGPLSALATESAADAALARSALTVLVVIPILAALTGVLTVAFRAAENTKPLPFAYAGAALLGALSAAPLVRALGLEGAAVGLVVTQVAYAALLAGVWYRRCSTAGAPSPSTRSWSGLRPGTSARSR